MSPFTFETDEATATFLQMVADRMVLLYQTTPEDAIDRINRHFGNERILSTTADGADSALYQEDADYWAKLIYYKVSTPLLMHDKHALLEKERANAARARLQIERFLLTAALAVLIGLILNMRAQPWGVEHPLAAVEAIGGPGALRAVAGVWPDRHAEDFFEHAGIQAIIMHDPAALDRLLQGGAGNRARVTWLRWALREDGFGEKRHGFMAMTVITLLANSHTDFNADVSPQSPPVMLACALQNIEATRSLLEHGANPDAVFTEYGDTALFCCHTSEYTKLLLAHGANPNVRNKEGETVLWNEVSDYQRLDVIALLLQAGADPYIRANDGRTALDVATPEDRKFILSYLAAHPKAASRRPGASGVPAGQGELSPAGTTGTPMEHVSPPPPAIRLRLNPDRLG
jgi:hypothetical protein